MINFPLLKKKHTHKNQVSNESPYKFSVVRMHYVLPRQKALQSELLGSWILFVVRNSKYYKTRFEN
jgi:hypothetical protein